MDKESHLTDSDVRVARIGKPHGIRGEVTVEVFTDSPETRFSVGSVLTVYSATASTVFETLTVEKARWNKNILLIKFSEFSDRNTAEDLRNCELYARSTDRETDEESWYANELAGFSVHIEQLESEPLGKITSLIPGPTQDLLEFELFEGGKVLIPFVEELVPQIDEAKHAVVIRPPAGLLELNQD